MASRQLLWRTPLVISLMFLASVALLIGNAVIAYRNQQSLKLANEWITHTSGGMERLAEIRALTGDAEAGVRGFALTGQDIYLQPYLLARSNLGQKLEELNAWIADKADQRERLQHLERLVETRIGQLDEIVSFRRQAGIEAPPRPEVFEAGKRTMDDIRATIRDMGDEERRLYSIRQMTARSTEQDALISTAVTAVISILIFAFFYYLLGLYVQERDRAQRALADVNENLENTIVKRTAELSGLSQYLLTVIEEEKAHIARELHDELGSTLTAINMDLSWLQERLNPQSAELATRLERARTMLASTTEIKRRIIENLRPSILDNLGLSAAIEVYIEDFTKRTSIKVEQTLTDDLDELPEHCPIAVFRVLQEALTNVARHSQAASVSVNLDRRGDDLILEVNDDGIGISPQARMKLKSHGLVGMRERAQQLGGRFEMGAGAGGKGTLVRAVVPCPRKKDDQENQKCTDLAPSA